MKHWLGTMACLALCGAVACSSSTRAEDDDDTGAGGGGAGGTATTGGDPWDKPACEDPNAPTGGTPPARADVEGALSPDGKEMMIFGGDVAIVVCGDIPRRDHIGDTWVLDVGCGGWEELAVSGPSPRARHAMAQDPARNRVLLFGGRYRDANDTMGPYTLYNDLWSFSWESRTWTQLPAQGTPPSPRANLAMVIAGDQLFVIGGNTATSGLDFTPQPDIHAYDLNTNTWREVAAMPTPPARFFHAAAYDPDLNRIFVIDGDGQNAFDEELLESWVFDVGAESWSMLGAAGPPTNERGRFKGGVVYRPASEMAASPSLFSLLGHDVTVLGLRNDVQRLDLGASPPVWSTVHEGDTFANPANGQCDFPADYVNTDFESPERRQGFAMGHRADGGGVVVFGGDSDCGRLNDTWWLNTGTGVWTKVRETIVGLSCPRTGNTGCSQLCQ